MMTSLRRKSRSEELQSHTFLTGPPVTFLQLTQAWTAVETWDLLLEAFSCRKVSGIDCCSIHRANSVRLQFLVVLLVTSIRDPKGNLTQIAYDAKGNPLTITDALNQVTTFTYNPQGLLLTTKDALNQTTTFAYDALGRLLTTTDPLNRITTLTYDAAGNVATSKDALNRVTTFTYDAKNRLVEIRDTNDGWTSYSYDGNGNLLTVTDAKHQVTTFAYDGRNRLFSTTDPLGKSDTYTYDGNDNLTTRHTPKGDDILFAYDAVNQLLSKTLPGSQITSYAYDLVGNLTNVTDPDSVLAMTYDQANRLTTVKTDGSSNQPAATLTYAYDKNGNRTTLTDPVTRTAYRYDSLNRLSQLGVPGPASCPTLPPGLVSRWLADGTPADAVGSNLATLRNGATFGPGLFNLAFHFDGVDDFLEVPDAASLKPAALTMSFWIKLDTLTSTSVSEQGLQWIFFKKNSRSTLFNAYGLAKVFRDGRHYLVFGINAASGQPVFVNATTNVVAGLWYHVVGAKKRGRELRAPHKFHAVSPLPWHQGFAAIEGVVPSGHDV